MLELINEYKTSFFGKTDKIRQTCCGQIGNKKLNRSIKEWGNMNEKELLNIDTEENVGKCRGNMKMHSWWSAKAPLSLRLFLCLESSWGSASTIAHLVKIIIHSASKTWCAHLCCLTNLYDIKDVLFQRAN